MVCQFYFKTSTSAKDRPDELHAFSSILDDLLTSSLEKPQNPIRSLKMNVDPAKGQPVNQALAKMEILLEFSAFMLDPRTFQRIVGNEADGLGMSIKDNQMQ
jgi:hypothetical protein